MRKPAGRPLTPDDWARAALRAIARGGVDAVAVEPIAAELGATKGSFYWHFKNRDALIEAALREWERWGVDAVIEMLEREPDPARRLKTLFATAFDMKPSDRATEVALLAKVDHPGARRAVRRVSQRRITYMAEQLEMLGCDPGEARDRAVLLGYLFVGYLQTAHVAPRAISSDSRRRRVELILETLVAGERPARSAVRKRAFGSSGGPRWRSRTRRAE